MQAAEGEGGGGSAQSIAVSGVPRADEKKLIDVLVAAPTDAHLVTLLKCINGWQSEGQANLHNWSKVLERLQRVLKNALEACSRLVLIVQATVSSGASNATDASANIEKEATEQVYEVLRFTALLLQNASNKHVYNSFEYITAFLGARNDRIVFEATRVMAMLSLPPQAHRHAVDSSSYSETSASRNNVLRRRLLVVAQGRGVANSSLDIVDFLNEASSAELSKEQFVFQFYGARDQEEKTESEDDAQVVSITIPPFNESGTESERAESLVSRAAYAAADTCEQLIQQYKIPAKLHFQLYTKIRCCYALRSKATRESIVVERLYANLALFYTFSESWDVTNYIEQNPELTRAIVELVRVELYDKMPVRVRVTALQVLTALVHDRVGRSGGVGVLGRQSHVLSALGVVKGTPHGVFPSLVRFCMSELGNITVPSSRSGSTSMTAESAAQPVTSESENDMDMSLAVAFVHATTDLLSPYEAEVVSGAMGRNVSASAMDAKLCWVEAVLCLLTAVVGIQLGAAVLTENGVIPSLLHVITVPSTSAFHAAVTTQCIQALETTVSNHASAAALYRDLNGVGILVDRLLLECSSVSTHSSTVSIPESKVVFLVALLVALSVSFHSQGVMSAGATSRVIREGSVLSKVLVKILGHVDVFGPVVFAQAAILVSDIINNDPSSVNHVHSGGIADTLLQTITRWNVEEFYPSKILLPPCSELIMSIPSVLNALSLTSVHAEKVAKYEPLMYLLDMLALPGYTEEDATDCFQGEVSSVVGAGIFELMRHSASFQIAAIQACIHALKKVIRFGEDNAEIKSADGEKAPSYSIFLRMANHVADVLEPILSKSEYAVSFADRGGIQLLMTLYRFVLPTTASFLSSAFSNVRDASTSRVNHHPAAQSITLALRAYASQQPTVMLTTIVKELSSQLDGLQRVRSVIGLPWCLSESGEGAEGVLCSLPDVELAELFADKPDEVSMTSPNAGKIGPVGEYLRVLATIEWLSTLLVWTMQIAQSHLQSRRWFTEFSSKPTQQVLSRLFGVDRSVQYERASLAALHKKKQSTASEPMEVEEKTAGEHGSSDAKQSNGLWKVGSLLLLRFTIVMRSLLVAYGKSFLSAPLQHRRGDDSVIPLTPHALSLTTSVAQILEAHIFYIVAESRAKQIDAFVRQYYLSFLLETIVAVLFEGKKKQANTLLLVELLKPLKRSFDGKSAHGEQRSMDDVNMAPQPPAVPEGVEEVENPSTDATSLLQVIMNIMTQFFKGCLDHQSISSVPSKVDLTSFRIAAAALRKFSDLESISASPLTAALVLNDESGDIGDIDGHFKPRVLSMQLHQECVRVLFSIWSHPQFAALPVDDCISDILPIAVVILRNRLDQGDAASALVRGNSDGDFGFLTHRHGLGFGRGRGSSSFEDETMSLRAAIFGRRSSGHTRSRHTFIPDPAIVGSLTAMGFPQARVEHAIRRIQINDVELAMEWILSHPDEDGNDEEKSQDEDEQDNKSADELLDADSHEDSEEKKLESALFESYSKLRDSFEEVSFRILQVQGNTRNELRRVDADPAGDTTSKYVYPEQNLVKTVAEYFVVMCERSDEEQNLVLSRVNASILGCFAPDGKSVNETDDRFFTLVTHLLALLLQLRPSSRDVLLRQKPCCVDSLVTSISTMATTTLAKGVSLSASCAPALLALDALVIGSTQKASSNKSYTEELLHPAKEETKRTEGGKKADASKDELLPSNFQHRLIQICLDLLTNLGKEDSTSTEASHRDLQATTAHAVMQLAAHVTLDYDIAHSFFSQGGIDLALNIREENMFIGYQDLACTLLSQVIESPEVLEQMMEDKILRALSKLSTRSDSLSQMRITPRALLMEVAPVAARNEEIFIKALGNAVQIKKGDSGRTYVVPRKASSTETPVSGSAPSASSFGHAGDEEAKEKKGSTHKIPKNHKHNIQTIATKIVEKIRIMWEAEKGITNDGGDVKKTPDEESKDQSTQPAVCVGTYLQLLVHLVTSFPICATVLAKSRECNSDGKVKFIRLVLKEFLPSKELCRFVAARKSLKEGGLYGNSSGLGTDLPLAEVTSFLNHRTRARVHGAHRLLVSIGSQSGEGSKCIIMELVHLLQEWPYTVPSASAGAGDLSVRDEESLSALHAWAGLMMSVLWPNGSTKGFAWDKVVPGGGLNGKHSFVTLLAEALRKVDLAHPLAHSTCSILLRPLATLTRTFVTHRVRKMLKKRNSASGTDAVADNSAAVSESAIASATGASIGAERTQNANARLGDPPSSLVTEVLTAEVTASAEDVAMHSPASLADDQEMREATVDENVSEDDESDRSSVSSHSTDEGEEEEEDDEDDEDDDEEDGDDDDEDDDDDDDDEDEEENQMRLRVIRRGGGHNYNGRRSSSRLWGSLDTDLSVIDALDEVDEEEFSYLNILDDEALFSEEQTRRARLQRSLEARRSSSRSSANDSGNAGESSVNSLLEAFLGSPDTTEALTNAISSSEEESPFDLPSGELFRDSIFTSHSQDQRGAGAFRNAVMQFIEELPDGGDENILFESFEMGNAGSRARRDRQGNRNELSGVSITHPLLRSTGSTEVMADTSGLRVPARLSLPRHSSLLRELQELSEHVQTQLPLSFGGRTRLGGRELLQRGGGRTRPPSRNNRLSAVSNLLSEFSLDIPTSQLSLNQSRSHRLGMRGSGRGDRDIFGGSSRSLRGEGGSANSASLWGPGGAGRNVDIRSVASRLEQRINQMYEETAEEEPNPAARTENANAQSSDAPGRNDSAAAEEDAARPREEVVLNPDPSVGTPRESEVTASGSSRTSLAGNDESSVSEDEGRSDMAVAAGDQTPGNELSSDTASVIALASTFGESTLRSPEEPDMDQMGSETETPNSPVPHERDVEAQTSGDTSAAQFGTLPPPAPVVSEPSSILSFTLDLSDLQAPPQRTAPSETQSTRGEMGDDEESKVDDAPIQSPAQESVVVETTELVCPEGIDPEVFASLPPDMQAEIVAQSAPPSTSTTSGNQGGSESFSQLDLDMANSSFDRETLEALPEDIRAEVLANERREREALAAAAAAPADVSRAQEMDNASFVASLAPELREEILVTCDDAFLQTLPSQVRAEAMVLRERAAFRTTYRERQPDAGRSGDGIGDLFQRPTLRRMLTSHGPDGVPSSSSRRSGRRNVYLDSNGNVRRGSRRDDDDLNGSAHAGMLRVDPDEDEDASERICDDKCVKGLLRLLYMAQSVVQNRVYQRVLTNICLYPLTRESVRLNALRVITRALDRPLMLVENVDDNFPPTGLFGCNDSDIRGIKSGQVQHGIPVDVVTRLLHVLVSLAKYNPRFAVELLQPHGMRRQGLLLKSEADLTVTNESGAAVLVELLTVPIVSRNGTNLDTLLELLELVLSPLERFTKKEDGDKKYTPENAEETQPMANESEWVTVPVVNLDAKSMNSIVSVLCMDICSPQMQERTVAILKLLNRVPENRERVIDAIVYHASALAKTSKTTFHGSSYESSAVLRSAQDELRLLRLLHTLSDICETTAAFTDYCHTIGLDPLWDQLSHSLEDARSKGGLDEKDGSVESPLESVVAAAAVPSTSDDENVDGMVIEGKSAGASCAMAALLARFLPMVEAFFVVNARDAASMSLQIPDSTEREEAFVANLRVSGFASTDATNAAATSVETTAPPTPTPSEAGESMRLANFVEANRVLLNILVREKPSLLDSSLAALIKMPRCRAYLDFDNKRTYFQSAMKKLRQTALRSQGGSSSVRIPVRRDHIFEDSYYALRMRSGQELRRKLHISFTGEEGIDAGGVTREWYMILAREIFNPNYVLFTSAADSPTFQPNPLSYVNKDHLSYFEFVGKVMGKAVADGQLLDAHFTRSFYKHILQLPISYHDMEAIDPEYYRNLHSILDNAIEDLGLELTFSAEQSNFGKLEIVDLIPNGRHVNVTDENKMEYVKLVTHHRMATGIRQQIDAFLKGFHQLVPPEMISIFNENELELLISGMPEIDIDDLKANTDYANFKPTDSVIRWFWNVLYSFTHEERALFLQFVTGTSKVPLEGFKALEGMRGTQKFNIHKAYGNTSALPSAHTCFNQLDLPEYESEEKLKQCLLLAIREGSEGFGFG